MEHPGFFERAGPLRLGDIAGKSEAECAPGCDPDQMVHDIATLDDAGPRDLSFLENPKYLGQYRKTHAGACIVSEKYAEQGPSGTAKLVAAQPYRSFALALSLFYPDALRSSTLGTLGWPPGEMVHPQASLEEGVLVEPGARIGAEASIGAGTQIAAGAVIGSRVHIGRDCYVGPNVNLTNTLVGNRVIIHAGASIGQDGFGFAMGPGGHLKVPQIGRVILQDDVEIGANTTIDRGALRDTVIGEGTKIDNLVQIGHNVVTGRHCVIVSQTGVSGSTELGDFVALGGQAGLVGHIKVGDAANVAAGSGVITDVPAGETWSGYPAQPHRQWLRQSIVVKKLASTGPGEAKGRQKPSSDKSDDAGE